MWSVWPDSRGILEDVAPVHAAPCVHRIQRPNGDASSSETPPTGTPGWDAWDSWAFESLARRSFGWLDRLLIQRIVSRRPGSQSPCLGTSRRSRRSPRPIDWASHSAPFCCCLWTWREQEKVLFTDNRKLSWSLPPSVLTIERFRDKGGTAVKDGHLM